MSNPLNTLLRPPMPDGPHYRWGYVTSISPTLQVVLDTETDPIQKPSTLVPLDVGDRVFVLMESLRATVLGKVSEPPVSSAAATLASGFADVSSAPPTVTRAGDVVTLTGRFVRSSGTGTEPFTIPTGYRPATNTWVNVSAINAGNVTGPSFAVAAIDTSGIFTLLATSDASPAWGTTTWIAVNGAWVAA